MNSHRLTSYLLVPVLLVMIAFVMTACDIELEDIFDMDDGEWSEERH